MVLGNIHILIVSISVPQNSFWNFGTAKTNDFCVLQTLGLYGAKIPRNFALPHRTKDIERCYLSVSPML